MSKQNMPARPVTNTAPAARREESITVRTRIRAGLDGEREQHSQTLEVRTRVRAGFDGELQQHSQALAVRTPRAAGLATNHPAIAVRVG